MPMADNLGTKGPVAVLDFEASSLLRGSYPIEVAVAFADTGLVASWLIVPTGTWAARGIWSPEAERVHGISRGDLAAGGHPVSEVCAALEACVLGYHVLSDATGLDGNWLRTLYAADGRVPPFSLASFWEEAQNLSGIGWPGLAGVVPNPEVDRALEIARQRYPVEHRAGDDARRLAEALRILGRTEPEERPRPRR